MRYFFQSRTFMIVILAIIVVIEISSLTISQKLFSLSQILNYNLIRFTLLVFAWMALNFYSCTVFPFSVCIVKYVYIEMKWKEKRKREKKGKASESIKYWGQKVKWVKKEMLNFSSFFFIITPQFSCLMEPSKSDVVEN